VASLRDNQGMEHLTTLADWLAHIEQLHPKGVNGIELGLGRIRKVAQRLELRFACPVFTVAGTNGKGSTCAMLESILLQAGLPGGDVHIAAPGAL
jgi:dihydrofolate synthase/folylpolyglutamate synthase